MAMDSMEEALSLAAIGRTTCAPNPMVGCVVVKNNTIIGSGAHLKAGEPHAEVFALAEAGAAAEGADVYVTLEPCCHFGRTPPCTDLLIKKKVKRVFVATQDPDARVNGRGIQALRDAGIWVDVGLHQDKAYELNRLFFHAATEKQPFVIGKWAMTLDGKIAVASGHSHWITSPAMREHGHILRAQVGAVMVGAQTLRQDNPRLTARLNERNSHLVHQPRPVVVSTVGDLPFEAHLMQPEAQALIIVGEQISQSRLQSLTLRGLDVVRLPCPQGGFHMADLLQTLFEKKIGSVLVEGGPRLLTSLHEARLIHQYVVSIAPKVIGGASSLSPIGGTNPLEMGAAMELKSLQVYQVGHDLCTSGYAPHIPASYATFLERKRTMVHV